MIWLLFFIQPCFAQPPKVMARNPAVKAQRNLIQKRKQFKKKVVKK